MKYKLVSPQFRIIKFYIELLLTLCYNQCAIIKVTKHPQLLLLKLSLLNKTHALRRVLKIASHIENTF